MVDAETESNGCRRRATQSGSGLAINMSCSSLFRKTLWLQCGFALILVVDPVLTAQDLRSEGKPRTPERTQPLVRRFQERLQQRITGILDGVNRWTEDSTLGRPFSQQTKVDSAGGRIERSPLSKEKNTSVPSVDGKRSDGRGQVPRRRVRQASQTNDSAFSLGSLTDSKMQSELTVGFKKTVSTEHTVSPPGDSPDDTGDHENQTSSKVSPAISTREPAARTARRVERSARAEKLLAEMPVVGSDSQNRHSASGTDGFHPRIDLGLVLIDAKPLQGVRVEAVSSGGFGESAGLQPGDRLVSINQRVVPNVVDLSRELRRYTMGDQLKIQFVRASRLYLVGLSLDHGDSSGRRSSVAAEQAGGNGKTVGDGFTINSEAASAANAVGQAVLGGIGAAFEGLFRGKADDNLDANTGN